MKKSLFATAFAIFSGCMCIHAAEISDVLTVEMLGSTSSAYVPFSGVTASSSAEYAGNTAYGTGGTIQMRTKSSDSGIVTTVSGGNVVGVSVTWGENNSEGRTLDIYGRVTPYASASDLFDENLCGVLIGSIVYGESTSIVITGDVTYIGLRSNSGACYFDDITVNWGVGASEVQRPVMTPAGGWVKEGTPVELTAPDAGAEIHYTTNGTIPTSKSKLYTSPIIVDADMTISAIAIKGGVESAPTKASFKVMDKAASIAEAYAAAKGDKVEIVCPLTVIYVAGAYNYVYDGVNYGLIYAYDTGLKPGDVIAPGWGVEVQNHNYLDELHPVDTPVVDGTAEVPPPFIVNAANYASVMKASSQSVYVKIARVNIGKTTPDADADDRAFTGTVAGTTIDLYNTFRIESVSPGTYDVEGFISLRGTLVQLSPTKFCHVASSTAPAFSVVSGQVYEGTKVSISCPDEDAEVHYTLDGSTPGATSPVYTAPIEIAGLVTVKAIAIGNAVSEVSTATYQAIPDPTKGENAVWFIAPDYSGINGVKLFNADGSATSTDALKPEHSLCEVDFGGPESESKPLITITFVHGDNQYYSAAFGNEVRWYAADELAIDARHDIVITAVEVATTAGSKGAFTSDIGTVTGSGVNADPIYWSGRAYYLYFIAQKQVRFSYIKVSYERSSGVEEVAVPSTDGPVEWYNLQGVRVDNPSAGLYIHRCGNRTEKILLR